MSLPLVEYQRGVSLLLVFFVPLALQVLRHRSCHLHHFERQRFLMAVLEVVRMIVVSKSLVACALARGAFVVLGLH